MKQKTVKRIILAVIGVVLAYLYIHSIYRLALQTDMDADYCFVLQEAKDIVDGNVFLSGWTQTGISFIMTDILYFVVSVAVFGFVKKAYIAGIMLMMLCSFASCYLLLEKKDIKNSIIFAVLTTLPTVDALSMQRSHTGGFIWCFVALFIIGIAIKKNTFKIWQAIIVALLIAMCSMSDMAALVFGAGAIIIICLYELVFKQDTNKKLYITLLISSVAGTILGMVMDKMYYIIGGADKNSFVGNKVIIDTSEIMDKIQLYFRSAFMLGNADFWTQPVFKLSTLIAIVNAVFVLTGIVLVIVNIVQYIRNKNNDMISVIMSLGYLLVAFLYIFTNIGIDVWCSRYFGTQPYIFAVLICRYFSRNDTYEKCIYTSRIKWKYALLVLAAVTLAGNIYVYKDSTKEWENINPAQSLGTFLQDNGLKNGYGYYFDSSVVTFSTGGNVKLRQVVLTGADRVYPYYWFCKKDWYAEPANFIVLESDNDDYGLNQYNAVLALGQPDKILKYEDYVIYVYDWDISTKIDYTDYRFME